MFLEHMMSEFLCVGLTSPCFMAFMMTFSSPVACSSSVGIPVNSTVWLTSFKATTVHQNWLMCGLPVGHMTTAHVITGSYDLSELLSLWNLKQHVFLSQTWKHLSVKLKCLIWCFHSRHSDSLHWSSSVMVTHSNLKMHWSLPLAVPDYIQIIQVSGKLCK